MNKIESLKSQLKEEIKRREQAERENKQFAKDYHVKHLNYEKLEQQLLSALAALKELQDERDKDKNLPKV